MPHIEAEIGLLLGNNVPDAYSHIAMKVGPPGSPHVTRTRIGLIAWNIIRSDSNTNSTHVVNSVNAAITKLEEFDSLESLYRKSVQIDFCEREIEDKPENSQEDKRFIEKMEQSQKIVDGHYEFCLPFKNDSPLLPNNQVMAINRLKSLQKKLKTNPTFYDDNTQFNLMLLKNGYAEEVTEEEQKRDDGKVWYLPHHGIYHPQKPTKIRVVFDCSAKWRGISLNDVLLQGPDLTNCLIDVLLKFRQEPVALIGDIEKKLPGESIRR